MQPLRQKCCVHLHAGWCLTRSMVGAKVTKRRCSLYMLKSTVLSAYLHTRRFRPDTCTLSLLAGTPAVLDILTQVCVSFTTTINKSCHIFPRCTLVAYIISRTCFTRNTESAPSPLHCHVITPTKRVRLCLRRRSSTTKALQCICVQSRTLILLWYEVTIAHGAIYCT